MVLAAVVVLAIVTTAADITTSYIVQKDREAELLFRGMAYRAAIKSYYEAGALGKTYPMQLADLIRDPRFPKKRHIRRLYSDPMVTDKEAGWALLRLPEGGIAGVASKGQKKPIKQANFPRELEIAEDAKSYTEWRFEYKPKTKPRNQIGRASCRERV